MCLFCVLECPDHFWFWSTKNGGQNVKMEAVLPTGGQIWSIREDTGGQNVKKEDVLPTGGHVAGLFYC